MRSPEYCQVPHSGGSVVARPDHARTCTRVERQDLKGAAALRDKEKHLLHARLDTEKQWTKADAGRVPLATELGQMNAKLDRLRTILHQRGIEPGDNAEYGDFPFLGPNPTRVAYQSISKL